MEHGTFKYRSPVGDMYCTFNGHFLIDVGIGEKEFAGRGTASRLSPAARSFFRELDSYFAGRLKIFRQKIKFTGGTDFERKVWRVLDRIPYGETRTYKWVAGQAGCPRGARAAGQAVGKNPLPIIVPCHRVIASDGSIGGFSCGIGVKRRLLRHEGRS